jgi:hypothetical protein
VTATGFPRIVVSRKFEAQAPEDTMNRSNEHLPLELPYAAPSWHEWLVNCLLGWWKSSCERAERPERKVPYY